MQNIYSNFPMKYNKLMSSGYPVKGHYMNEELVRTIQDCEATCEHMTHHIKKLPDYNMRIRQAVLLRECADICGITAKFIARNAIFSKHVAALCANICDACGTECARFPDEMSQHCAEMCFHCAKECRVFAGIGM